MIGRENPKDNDLFFTCSLIEYIGRKTKNYRSDVVDALGFSRLEKIYELADVYHSDNIDRVSDDFIAEAGIREGNFDNVAAGEYSIPSHWDIGKVYKRLILGIAKEKNIDVDTGDYRRHPADLSSPGVHSRRPRQSGTGQRCHRSGAGAVARGARSE